MQFVVNIIINGLLVVGGLAAYVIYYLQRRAKKRDAAALIVTQIEELKDKLLQIDNIVINKAIDEKLFYETLDIIPDNQWEKYKHIFIKKMDYNSFKTINVFYNSILSIKEQLAFTKQLLRQQFFNIQGMLDSNCNAAILETLNLSLSPGEFVDLKHFIMNSAEINNANEDNKNNVLKMLNLFEKSYLNHDANQFWKIYNQKKELLISVINSGAYPRYVPEQIAETLGKEIKRVESIEIIGSEGYRKLKKIAKR